MTSVDPVKAVREAMKSSEMLRDITAAKETKAHGRPLAAAEVDTLKRQGCSCDDWSRVRVCERFRPEFVRNSYFRGEVYLGEFGKRVEITLAVVLTSGVYNSTVAGSSVCDGALVQSVGILSRTYVAPGAVLLDVGEVTALSNVGFGCGTSAAVGLETGGREVMLFPEITIPVAARVSLDRSDKEMQIAYAAAVGSYADAVSSTSLAFIGHDARVLHTTHLRGVYVGPHAIIDGALGLGDVSMLSTASEPATVSAGALVYRAVIQWGALVSMGAIVEDSAVLEHAHVCKHACVNQSIIGPSSVIEKGEVTSSLVGPLVAQHHQSLLISAVWPEGRGNVAAGALVGSNHTGRAADQAIIPGEGTFFGLGAKVKFPADFSRAPYLMIASGVLLPPQRIDLPFALIRKAGVELSRAAERASGRPVENEILPGWVLSESAYTLARSARKYAARYDGRRTLIEPEPLRPEILDLVREARRRLSAAPEKDIYTSADVPGLGANVMTGAAWRAAVSAYTTTIVRVTLLGLWSRLRTSAACARDLAGVGLAEALASPPAEGLHPLLKTILLEERPEALVGELLGELVELQEDFARAVEGSKARDDTRGSQIVDGYADAHVPAPDESNVCQVREEAAELRAQIEAFLDARAEDGAG